MGKEKDFSTVEEQPMQENKQEVFPNDVTHFIKESPYYLSCCEAFEQKNTRYVTPYKAAYWAAHNNTPLSYSAEEGNPSFHEVVYNEQRPQHYLGNMTPYMEAYCRANSEKPFPLVPNYANYGYMQVNGQPILSEVPHFVQEERSKQLEQDKEQEQIREQEQVQEDEPNTKYYKKRPIVMLLILILSIVCVAIPILTSLGTLSDIVDLEIDILEVSNIANDISLENIQSNDNIPLLLLSGFMIFALALMLNTLLALFSMMKHKFGLFALIAFIFAVGFILTYNPNILSDPMGEISYILENYARIAILGAPLVMFLMSRLSYKEIK